MYRQSLVLLALLLWALSLASGAAQRRAKESPTHTNPAVQALLRSAGKEPAAAALATLRKARDMAQRGKDHGVLLAVAATAQRLGEARRNAADYAGAEQFHRLGLSIREQQVPGTAEHAGSLVGLARALADQDKAAAGKPLAEQALVIYGRRGGPASLALAACLHCLAKIAVNQGNLPAAKELLQRALGIREQLAPGSLDVAGSLNGLGVVAHEQGDQPKARAYFGRALAIQKKLAPGSLDVARSLGNLGTVAGDRGRAREYHEQALTIQEKLAPGSLEVARTLTNLGQDALSAGDAAKVKAYHERALAIRERLAPTSSLTADNLNSLGCLAREQGDLVKARAYLERARAIHEQQAPGSYDHAGTLVNLGMVADSQGDWSRAKELYTRALAILERVAPGSAYHANCLINLGNVVDEQGELAKAKEYFERALVIREKLASPAGTPSLAVADSLNSLGIVAEEQRDLARAKEYHERALAIREKLAPGSMNVAASLNNLGIVAVHQGDPAKAKAYHTRALVIRQKLAPGSYEYAGTLVNLGLVAADQGDLAGATGHYHQALAILERVAPGSPFHANCLDSLGRVAWWHGDMAAAREYFERTLAIREKLAPGSPAAADCLHNLGLVAEKQGDLAKSREYWERALAIRRNVAPGSPEVADSLNGMACLLDESGDLKGAEAGLRQSLAILNQAAPNSVSARIVLRNLAEKLLDTKDAAAAHEAQAFLTRARAIEEAALSLSRDADRPPQQVRRAYPEVRFLAPPENSEVRGNQVEVRVAFLAPIPLARYRVWINGRPFGKSGFELPRVAEPSIPNTQHPIPNAESPKGQILDRGEFEKGRVLARDIVLEKGQILDRDGSREALARALVADDGPPTTAHRQPNTDPASPNAATSASGAGNRPTPNADLAELVKQPQYANFQLLRLKLPVDDTDGEFLRIAISAETTGGSISDRRILRLRRPEAERQRGSLRVLAVGVADYDHLPKLKCAAADALDLGAALQQQAADGILYRSSADITILTNADATLGRLRDALEELARNARPGDTLVVSFSGHGVKQGHETYFAPARFDPENAAGTGLPWKEVLAKLETARKTAKAVWVLADCCRAAPGLRREQVATAVDLKRGVEEGGNLIVCTASSGDTPSYESEELGHGLFTQAWLEALRGEVPPQYQGIYQEVARGRVLDLSGLQFLVNASVKRHARQAGVRQQVEFPRLEGSFSPGMPVFVPAK